MGYDLHPRRRNVGAFHVPMFSWTWMLEAGLGLVICAGRALKPGEVLYESREGKSPFANDGFRVTAAEARMMGLLARNLSALHRVMLEEYERELKKGTKAFARVPLSVSVIGFLERFAEWAPRSGGFEVW